VQWQRHCPDRGRRMAKVCSRQNTGGSAEVTTYVWIPHSSLSVPAQRPSRPLPGSVHGAQPIES
jgi:hypothetical protein